MTYTYGQVVQMIDAAYRAGIMQTTSDRAVSEQRQLARLYDRYVLGGR